MLTRTVQTTKQVPCKIITLDRFKECKSARLQSLPCTACHKPIGNRPWAIGWYEDTGGKRAMRLCDPCADISQESLRDGE